MEVVFNKDLRRVYEILFKVRRFVLNCRSAQLEQGICYYDRVMIQKMLLDIKRFLKSVKVFDEGANES